MTNIFRGLCEQLLMSESELKSYISSVPFRYKRYYIPKRNSNELRLIAHPAKVVKSLQRHAVSKLEPLLPIHKCAMAYCKGKGIKENAYQHKNNRFLLKMDLRDFFGSINPSIFLGILQKHDLTLSKEDVFLLSNLFFWKLRRNSPLRLSVGAPSSPFVSNAIMYFFDKELHEYCNDNDIVYTRYADDMTFSTNKKDILFALEKKVKAFLKQNFGSSLRVNNNKTIHSSTAHNRHVTGITITNNKGISVGRNKKRKIRACVYSFKSGLLSNNDVLKLKGELGFIKHIEPDFIINLTNKYGLDTIKKIQTFESVDT
ncbi:MULTISPECIES: retron St85 family RNA-directed DNA polymerase [Aeromonas]|uniref:retron St85 family RNA-directed DNA polymerase n=1 Tax=Aeromonas TaxID=642 RepID=UPI001B340303|nr:MULTISPECIES: retron St85 family RNA-directed DNA polymerase [Aeromonas]MBP4032063.1 retron St85 family RNA-directed DNA polymerase [Aeromonas sp. PrichA-15]MDT8954835.1 retron St85 family RNA-directed DNA polymerase [Aeromonas caviae]